MSDLYEIVDYSNEYSNDVIEIFQDVFKSDRDNEFLEWENETNPSGESIIKLALKDSRIIGHICFWLFKMKVSDKTVLSGQAIDTMVHPEYRGKGIFEKLSLSGIETGLGKEMELCFRFPNHMALSAAVNKLGFVKVCKIPQYLKIIKADEASGMLTANRLLKPAVKAAFKIHSFFSRAKEIKTSDYEMRTIGWFDESFDELWKKERNNYKIAVERSSDYLNWRYIKSPRDYNCVGLYKSGSLVGYIVTAIEDKVDRKGNNVKLGHIVDILAPKKDGKALEMLLQEAEKELKEKNVCAVSCWMLKHHHYIGGLLSAGYLQLRSPSNLAALSLNEADKAMGDIIYNSKNWYITIGDSDYI